MRSRRESEVATAPRGAPEGGGGGIQGGRGFVRQVHLTHPPNASNESGRASGRQPHVGAERPTYRNSHVGLTPRRSPGPLRSALFRAGQHYPLVTAPPRP